MDFDHRESDTKLFEISKSWKWGKKKVMQEIAKCDVVCANCHRIRTYKRAGHFDSPNLAAKKRRGLTAKQIHQVLILHATGKFTHRQIAQRHGVHRSAISHLLAKKRREKVYGGVNDFLADGNIDD